MISPVRYVNERLFRVLRRIVQPTVDGAVRDYFFDVYLRERLYRQEFFFNAFKALRFNGIGGDYAEFGTARGTTFAMAYHEARRRGHQARLWAFDSFEGLPPAQDAADEHPEWEPGRMATGLDEFHRICAKNGIPRDAYAAVPGLYEQTLASMSPRDEPTDIALAYIDCDLYTSAKTVLEFLEPRMKHGMIVALDDYFCWSPSEISGERKALLEFVSDDKTWEWTPFVQYGWHGESFVIEARRLTEAASNGARSRPSSKLLAAAAALYLVMPFDLIPDFIPVVGHFDDAIIIAVALRAIGRMNGPGRLATLWSRTAKSVSGLLGRPVAAHEAAVHGQVA